MAVILAARRTAVMPRGGAFARLTLHDLAAPVVEAVLADSGIEGVQVNELICANALGGGGNPARLIALAAGLPERVAGVSIDRQCAGGLDAILLARALVDSGAAQVVLAGGVESFSRRPLRFRTDPDGGAAVGYDRPAFTPWADRDPEMTVAAAALADRLGISRRAQEAYAVQSHARAMAGRFPEIVQVQGQRRDGYTRTLTAEIAARSKALAGTVSAASTAVEADAAAFCLVVADDLARGHGWKILGGATLGADPVEPGMAPVAAVSAALRQAGIAPQELEVSEMMEAYAVQAMGCIAALGLDPERVNLGGGALARGHPIGASGAILAVRLCHELRRGAGLAAIAAAGGIGSALVIAPNLGA